jgi:raffinose/stachyose/melibiose transport system substrate-binding protein
MRSASIALTAMLIAGLATPVFADTAVSIVDVQESAVARALWDRIAKDYEADHKGVTVNFKYIEGESYKEKLTTMLQSEARPDIVYSWGGGVMEAQNQAGFLKDITAEASPFEENLAQTAVNAFWSMARRSASHSTQGLSVSTTIRTYSKRLALTPKTSRPGTTSSTRSKS